MRASSIIFWVLSVWFFLCGVTYVWWNLADFYSRPQSNPPHGHPPVEWAGTIGLGLLVLFAMFVAFYLQRARAGQGGDDVSDLIDANIDDGDSEIGFFSPWSWWPILLAGSIALVFLGVAVGVWIAIIAVPAVAICVVGLVYEYSRGYFGH